MYNCLYILRKLHILKQDEAVELRGAEVARMVVLGKPTCRHPLMWTQEKCGGPFQRWGRTIQVTVLLHGAEGRPQHPALQFCRCALLKDVVVPHLIGVEAGTSSQPAGGLGGLRAGGAALQLVETVQAAGARAM